VTPFEIILVGFFVIEQHVYVPVKKTSYIYCHGIVEQGFCAENN
jgi:hypothetical protein